VIISSPAVYIAKLKALAVALVPILLAESDLSTRDATKAERKAATNAWNTCWEDPWKGQSLAWSQAARLKYIDKIVEGHVKRPCKDKDGKELPSFWKALYARPIDDLVKK